MTEWTPLAAGKNTAPEDTSKMSFHYSRICNYAHKRTTMLMFGPPIAPTRQVQYLYIPNHTPGPDALGTIKPSKFVVMFVTQFEGIPFADTFKVAQYYTVETKSTSADHANKTALYRVGVNLHFIKSTMFKTNIITGTKDEMIPAVKTYYGFVKNEMLPARNERLPGKKSKATPAKTTKKAISSTTSTTTTVTESGKIVSTTEERNEEIQESSTMATRRASRRMSKRIISGGQDSNVVYQWNELGYWKNIAEGLINDPPAIPIVLILLVVVIWQWTTVRGLRSQLNNVQESLETMKATLDAIQQTVQTVAANGVIQKL